MITEPCTARLLRLWPEGYGGEPIHIFTDDWKDGHFTVKDGDITRILLECCSHRQKTSVFTVYSTDELEWDLDTVSAYDGQTYVTCIPRLQRLRKSLTSDAYLIQLWLEAEKRWLTKFQVEALAKEVHRGHRAYLPHVDSWEDTREGVRDHCRALAAHLIDSGWIGGEPE